MFLYICRYSIITNLYLKQMRPHFFNVLISLAFLAIVTPKVCAQEATFQVVLAAEMPDITNPEHGFYAELKRLVETERNQIPTTFFLFGGGSIGPSALSNLDRGSHIVDILNSLEPDAMGVSKREFSFGMDELSLRSYEAAFPIVASNLIDTRLSDVSDGLADRALISRNNIKLGFISVSDKRLIQEYLLRDIIVEDRTRRIRLIAKELRIAGADFIIVHYFDDFPKISILLDDQVVDAAYVSNTRLSDKVKQRLAKDKRVFVPEKPGQAMVVNFSLNSGFPLVSMRNIDLSTINPDPAVINQIGSYILRLNRLLDDDLAYWDGVYTTRRDDVRAKENAFANFVVDAMREFGKADIAIINSGSIRGDKRYDKNAQITSRTIATELPFRSTLSVISVTGKQLIEALEVGFAGLDILKGTFPQVSGMQITFDSSSPQGSRVLSVLINGAPLNTNKEYLLATTDYLVSGGDGYVSFSAGAKKTALALDRTILISDLVLRTLRVKGKLDGQLEQRIVDKASKP
jgi:5'-nucleotidase/UDP-sugar diphosphatase